MSEAFPRLLVATEFSPNAPGGGPAVVRQLLRDWPVEKLFWWSCRAPHDHNFGQKVAGHLRGDIPEKLYPHRRWVGQKTWVLENIWVRRAAGKLQRDIARVQPEAIWVIPHGWSIPPLAKVLAKSPVGFHVSIHDYADCGFMVRTLGLACCQRLLAMADRLYAEATTRDAICQPMVEDARLRTGRDGDVARAGLERADFDFLRTPPRRTEGPLRIAYPGTIQVEETFALFIAALKKIQPQLPRRVTLEFYGNHTYKARPWFDPAWMTEHGNLSAADLAQALRGCDWGFSPMSLTDDDPRYNHFSLPTKFVSYLGAGLPMIALGHPESSALKMAAAHDIGLCAHTLEVEVLAGQLLKTLSEPDPAAKYRARILRCAEREFDANRIRGILYDNLRKCASFSRGAKS